MNETKALDLMEKAEKKLNSFGWFGGNKYEAAEEMFVQAGNLFKMCKKWQEAGGAYLKAAECNSQLQNKHEVASNYVLASNCFKKTDVPQAINCLRLAIEIYCDIGRFSIASKHEKAVAELYEAEGDLEEAIAAYQSAAEMYAGEDATSSANGCLQKVALFAAQLEQYERAIEVFEQIALSSIDNTLLKYSVKEYLFCAGLCHMCTGEYHVAARAIDRYEDIDMSFGSTRECALLRALIEACEARDLGAFTDAVIDFDQISKLNNWKTTMLLRIKNGVQEPEGDDLT